MYIDREKFALCTCWRDNRESSLKFYGKPASLKSIRYLWLYLAELDDSKAEIVQIYRKSVLSKLLQCAVNIQVIFDREKFSLSPGLLPCTGETIENARWNFTASRRALKSIRYLWFYLAELDDSKAEIVQIYRKSVLSRFTVVSIQSRFDTSRFDTNQSRFDTHVKSFRYTSKVVSIQTEVNSIQPLFTWTIVLIC